MDKIEQLMKHHTKGGRMIRHYNGEKEYILKERDMNEILEIVKNFSISNIEKQSEQLPTDIEIETISKRKGSKYLPAQVLGNKRVLRSNITMTIKECKKFIADYKAEQSEGNKGEWVLLEIVANK